MSACLVIQQNQKCYIGADSAISGVIDNYRIRLSNNGQKLFKIDDQVIFCSGEMDICHNIMDRYKNNKRHTVKVLQNIAQKEYGTSGSLLEIFVVKYHKQIYTYQLSSYNEFEIIERITDKGNTQVWALGFKTNEILESFDKYVGKVESPQQIFIKSYNNIVCPEVGGNLTLYEVSDTISILLDKHQLKDNHTIFDYIHLKKHMVIADTIVGRILIGEKLYISDATGLFQITGNGLTIYDEGNKERVFLGVENNQAKFQMWDKDGNKVVLDDSGIVQTWQMYVPENISNGYPMRIPIHYPEGTVEVRSFKLYINLEQYRSYSQGVSAGGSFVSASTTSDGGYVASTTSSGGYVSTSTSSGGNYSNSTTSAPENWTQLGAGITFSTNLTQVNDLGVEHGHLIDSYQMRHNHSVTISVPSHSHSFVVDNHYHNFQVGNHNHNISLNIPNHEHPQINDIFVGNMASNVSINVNGQTIAQNINASGWYDITAYINTSDNLITISGTNGRIEATLVNKSFVAF